MQDTKKHKVLCLDIGGTRTKMGLFDASDKPLEKTFATRDLFSDVDMVYARIKSAVKNKFCLELGDISKMSIAVPGNIDEDEGRIINSTVLNAMSWKKYNGFNFKHCFGGDMGHENVFAMNDAKAAALGVVYSFPSLECPALVITLGTGCGTCLIHSASPDGLEPVEWGTLQIRSKAQGIVDLHCFLGDKAIECARGARWAKDMIDFYSDRVLRSIQLLKSKYITKFSGEIKSVVLLGGKVEYVNRKKMKIPGVELIVPDDEEQKKIPLLGCFYFT